MKAERQNRILEYLKDKEIVKNIELEKKLCISRATLNRDLKELEERQLLLRSHGGVVGERAALTYEPIQREKEVTEKDCKIAIAKEATKLMEHHSSFILDSGSTILYLAKEIVNLNNLKSKIFATNDLKNAMTLASIQDIELNVFGGRRRNGLYSLYSDLTREAIESFCVDIYFMGADALDAERGVTNVNFDEVSLKRSMMKASKKTVLLVDHTKFSKVKVAKICDVSQIDMIITDDKVPLSEFNKLKKLVKEIIIVERR